MELLTVEVLHGQQEVPRRSSPCADYDAFMAARRFKVVIEWVPDEEVWVTYVPSLGHLSTYGDTREEALEQTREAVLGYLEAAAKDDLPVLDETHLADIVEIEVAAP